MGQVDTASGRLGDATPTDPRVLDHGSLDNQYTRHKGRMASVFPHRAIHAGYGTCTTSPPARVPRLL